MKVQFNETFAAVIVALLLLVCFCRQILQALAALAELCDRCSASCCDCHCIAALTHGDVPRRAVALYCLFLPLTFNLIFFWHTNFSHFDWASSVVLVDFRAVHSKNGTVIQQTENLEVDYILCVMPFALAAALNCLIWLKLSNERGLLTADTAWDDALPEVVLYYELAYCAELLFANFSLIVVSTSGRTVYEVLYATAALTVVQCFFVCGARHRHDAPTERVTTAVLTILLVAVVLPLGAMLQRDCVVAEAVASVHLVCVCIIAGLHHIANGEASASSILAVRVGTTVLESLAHFVVLFYGRNRACQT